MNVLIVYAHHEPQSINRALFEASKDELRRQGHEVRTTDLYAMNYDPVSSRKNFTTTHDPDYLKQQLEERYASENDGFAEDIEKELQKVEWCELMIWQFPLWWLGLPAILKGWVDKTFAMNRSYNEDKNFNDGLFRGKKAMISMTTGNGAETFVEGGSNGNIDNILKPILRGIFQFVGFDVLQPNIVYNPSNSTYEERKKHVKNYVTRLETITDEAPIVVGEF